VRENVVEIVTGRSVPDEFPAAAPAHDVGHGCEGRANINRWHVVYSSLAIEV
jgi:hypothetical protein